MTISPRTQATLLLTAHFEKAASGAVKPLTPKEWGRFAKWLDQWNRKPEDLLLGAPEDLLDGLGDKAITIDRVKMLLDRGTALAISLEKWLRSGLWVMSRSAPDYPRRLKQRLGSDSPAILFGCGNRGLLNAGGLAVVGSRNVNAGDLEYSRRLGAHAADAGVSIVSGGARGVDESAMLGALAAEGTAVGVLADSLMRACTGAKYRKHLMDNNLALVSPFNPEAGFNAGNAMQRNKYIYCLADAALAVHSGKKGGTWTGAQEDLKKAWVPLWVKPTDDPDAGNAELIAAGGLSAPADIDEVEVAAFFGSGEKRASTESVPVDQGAMGVGEREPPEAQDAETDAEGQARERSEPEPKRHDVEKSSVLDEMASSGAPPVIDLSKIGLYDLFIAKVKVLCDREPCTTEQLVEALAIKRAQANEWLKQAVADGELRKHSRPVVKYEVVRGKQGSLGLE